MPARATATLIAGLWCGVVGAVAGQVPTRPPADTGKTDTTKVDSLHPKHDTLTTTQRLLQAQQAGRIGARTLPLAGVSGLQPAGTRIILDRDSIDWAPAETLGELLQRVPGVFLAQGGWLGSPALPNYQAHGAGSVEYYLDGRPEIAIGPDSVAFDPTTFALGFLDRVEIETGPSLLRVYLFTRRLDHQAPRTKIGVSSGDRGLARYFGSFERRYPSGLGLTLAADYFGVNPVNGGTGAASVTNGWGQLDWTPSEHLGLQAQYLTQAISRDLFADPVTSDTLIPQLSGTRTDETLRGSWQQRTDGLGPRVDLFASRTSWGSDSLNRAFGSFGGIAAWRHPTWSAQFSTWTYSAWTSLDSRANLGWNPIPYLSGSVELIGQQHSAGRTSDWGTARLGLTLPKGFRIGATVRDGHRVANPSLASDLAERFTDEELTAAFVSKPLGLQAGYTRDDGWLPTAFQEFSAVAAFARLPPTNWLTIDARVTPMNWLTLESVYQQPQHGLPDGVPPTHAYTTATVQSKFLRNFPSGIFNLKVQGVMESWSPGVGGRDSLGNMIPLPGATFLRGIFQLQIGPFIAYYDEVNMKATKTGAVPGYPILSLGKTFGVRWEFSN